MMILLTDLLPVTCSALLPHCVWNVAIGVVAVATVGARAYYN